MPSSSEKVAETSFPIRGTVVAISHDRYFLDRTVTRIIEVLDGKAEFYSGNYSFYAVEKERRFQERMKQYQKEQAKIEQLEKAAEQLRLWAFQGMDKTYRRYNQRQWKHSQHQKQGGQPAGCWAR